MKYGLDHLGCDLDLIRAASPVRRLDQHFSRPYANGAFQRNVCDFRRLWLSPQLPPDVEAAISRPARATPVAQDAGARQHEADKTNPPRGTA